MSIIQAIIIAIVEGLTEFLPVSSTAHMRFTNPLIGVSPSPFVDMFEVVIQLASILCPGLSRSAATIVGGMSQHLTRRLAAEFSFFVAVPTMFAASVKSFWDVYKEHPEVLVKDNMSILAIGAVIAFFVALLSVKF